MFHRERQQQLEELTRELKKVTEETDYLKSKLQAVKPSLQVCIQTVILWLICCQWHFAVRPCLLSFKIVGLFLLFFLQSKCQNCHVMEKQLQSKIIEVRDKETTVIGLQQLCSKMEKQLVQQVGMRKKEKTILHTLFHKNMLWAFNSQEFKPLHILIWMSNELKKISNCIN